jgi:hypothetical protein
MLSRVCEGLCYTRSILNSIEAGYWQASSTWCHRHLMSQTEIWCHRIWCHRQRFDVTGFDVTDRDLMSQTGIWCHRIWCHKQGFDVTGIWCHRQRYDVTGIWCHRDSTVSFQGSIHKMYSRVSNLVPVPDLDIGLMTGVTGRRKIYTPPKHLISPLVYLEVRSLICISCRIYTL